VTPVDANIARVTARLFGEDAPRATLRRRIETLMPRKRQGDFAQALMDLGASFCAPRQPDCVPCPVREHCVAHARGLADSLPARKLRAQRPVRRGTAFWLEREGEVLLVRRPPRGLLGGMRALPTSAWTAADAAAPLAGAPARADWRLLDTRVRHVFTHFALELSVAVARAGPAVPQGEWTAIADLPAAGLPTVFRKAADAALAARA